MSGEEFLQRLEEQMSQEEQEQPKKSRLGFIPGAAPKKDDPVPTLQFDLAEEINDIFQGKLKESPMSEFISAKIESAPDGGIQINVDGKYYDGPDQVPDPVIKDMIKASIQEWEKS
jgi:hypothetical protein